MQSPPLFRSSEMPKLLAVYRKAGYSPQETRLTLV